jgi:uncharacterized protein with LGFP repeats
MALALPVVILSPPASGPAAADTPLRLTSAGTGVSQADVPLAGRLVQRVDGGRRTTVLRTTGYSMAGVTWTGEKAPGRVAVRWPDGDGGWSHWRGLPRQSDLPAASEQGDRNGTQPVWTGRHHQLQLEVLGHRPRGLRLTLINTGPTEETAVAPSPARALAPASMATATAGVAARRPARAPRPKLLGRNVWHADPSWRNGSPSYIKTIRQAHIHHTATANDYAPGDVPGLLRGMYYYHTHSLGWFDIAYNFLIDRFGRIWVGRSGGADRAVRGAHTLGFNHESVGIALIGRFGKHPPSAAALSAVVRVAAWKLDAYGAHPRRKIYVRSKGSDRFPAGSWARLPTVDGHRDTNQTSCPGAQLYRLLPSLRDRIGRRVNRYDP